MSNVRNDKRIILGGFFIALGIFWILEVVDIIPYYIFEEFLSVQGFAFLLGLFLLATSRHKFLGAVFTIFGGYYLLDEFFYIPYNVERMIFPAFLILLGVFIIMRSRRREEDNLKIDPDSLDFIDEVSIFGGGERNVESTNFRGGKITAVFGGSDINFKKAKLGEGRKVIDVFVLFGGSKMVVPEDWNIKTEVTPILGGFSDKRKLDPNAIPDPRKELVVKGVVIFGGVEIKSF